MSLITHFSSGLAKLGEKYLPILGSTTQGKGKQIMGVHGLNDFKALKGWPIFFQLN